MEKQLIDPRAPRVGAAITSVFALGAFAALLYGQQILGLSLLAYTTFMFIWSVFFSKIVHPYSIFFVKVVRTRLNPPAELEDPRAPFFAQKIGLMVSSLAFVFSFVSPLAGAVFAAMLFLASALNAYLNVCLGCILYLRLRKLGINL